MSQENKYTPPQQAAGVAHPAAGDDMPAADATPPTGYTPPGVAVGSPAIGSASGYTAPGAAPGAAPEHPAPGAAAPARPATGYVPPSVAAGGPVAPASENRAPRVPAEPEAAGPRGRGPGAQASPPATEAAPDGPPVPPARRRNPLALALVALLLLALAGLVVAYLLGAFEPKMSHLPASVAGYARDTVNQHTTSTEFDSTTYRAGAGDIYQAAIKKNASDPAIAFNKATADSRLQLGNVYCTGVSKTGKGAICSVLLPTGSSVYVDGSTRHTAQEVAQFTQDLAAAIK